MKPTIALFAGDPAGVGPELVARLLADGSACRAANVLIIGSRESIEDGMRVAGSRFVYSVGNPTMARERDLDEPLLARGPTLDAKGFKRGVVTPEAGRYMLDSLAFAIGLW